MLNKENTEILLVRAHFEHLRRIINYSNKIKNGNIMRMPTLRHVNNNEKGPARVQKLYGDNR